ncbi:hypothetical protein TCAL_01944 [Tigriopus californicus]|uniref:Coiled-coil domain-containing protein 22 homolog n=1 Tax=Tigriopus californicus TaxID=6832 RepID=A0A553P817_TIGCA|nr:coiled-coil domain-containing protein 22-like [Tigriopus californicus]TRY73790.1 hypothetical protein TCAL_01944 [Tigriopus californicus]|eukprot:TCALIF_01944-PA protein Name:"Similar to CG9951 Coiled-coil domain-containing protein 22 homolog (Drosophila melanogaster)" AED:0.00 eAED:0.00 QI:206/1/1/1/0.83/0.85/7/32/567
MDPGDRILIQSLRLLGVELTEDAQLLKMSSKQVLQSIALCLEAINGDGSRGARFDLPSSLSERFDLGAELAQRIQSLGYQGSELGYQSLLYPNEQELRSVFMFLLDRIPHKLDADEDDQKERNQVEDQVEHDEFCTCPKCFHEIELDIDMVNLLPKESRNAAFNLLTEAKARALKEQPLYPIETETKESNVRSPSPPPKKEFLSPNTNSIKVGDLRANFEHKSHEPMKPVIPSKPQNLTPTPKIEPHPIPETSDQSKVKDEPLEDPILKALHLEKRGAQTKYDDSRDRYQSLRSEVMALNRSIMERKKRQREVREDLKVKRDEIEKRKSLLDLMPRGDENVDKLKAIILKTQNKIEQYEQQWEETKKALIDERSQLEAALKTKEESNPSVKTPLQETNGKIAELESKLREANANFKKFSALLDRRSAGEPRSNYTQRILDVLKSIARQREETERIILDIKSTQKDINLLDGKLFRTYAEVERLIFDTAHKDSSYVPAYKMVTSLHDLCQEIIDRIGQNGKIKRLVRDLRDQIDSERAKNTQATLDQMEGDLNVIKQENLDLLSKLKS